HDNQIQGPTARSLAWLGNLHYWAALQLLEQHYRFGDQAARALALAQMTGPMFSIGRHLPKLGAGMPFDPANFGASPALDAAHARRMTVALLKEAGSLARRLEPALPPDYAPEITMQALAVLQADREPAPPRAC